MILRPNTRKAPLLDRMIQHSVSNYITIFFKGFTITAVISGLIEMRNRPLEMHRRILMNGIKYNRL